MEPDTIDARSPAGGNDGSGGARVLIAEDDPASRELLTQLVEALGHETQAVADGAARAGTTLAAGVHQFKATYSGAGAFDGYSSIVYYLAVNQAGACE